MHDTSTAVLIWWLALTCVGVLNLALWTRVARAGTDTRMARAQLALSAVFTAGCAFRSFLPRAEAQRICLLDLGWVSSAAVARTVATFAELSLVTQLALLLAAAAPASWRGARAVAAIAVPTIALAECFSWYTALTTNFFGSVIEESLWALTGTLLGVAFLAVGRAHRGATRRFATAIGLGAFVYVAFMCTVDVPMYWSRYQRDEAEHRAYLGVLEGASDSAHRRVVTRSWHDWREEMPWMSLYFSVGVWLSIGLVRHPRFAPSAAR